MMCPKCTCDTHVVDSRFRSDERWYRRRECLQCGYRFTSVEITVEQYKEMLMMIPPDGKTTSKIIDEALNRAVGNAVVSIKNDLMKAMGCRRYR